jgi:glucan phosphoethanolaminetransferase (alkaline phosphatase superfamily)
MNKFNNAVGGLYTLVLKAAMNRHPAYIAGSIVLGTIGAFASYWIIGLLAGGLVQGAYWIVVLSLGITAGLFAVKAKMFHTWKAGAVEGSQALMSLAILGALSAAPTLPVLLVCHFGSVIIGQLTQRKLLNMSLVAMGGCSLS